MSIQVLSEKQVPKRQIARELGVSEGTVRYHLRRRDAGAVDGRKDKPMRASALAGVIERWWSEQTSEERPPNVLELHEVLQREHGYVGSYKSVLRYTRRRWGWPKLRTYRRVETPPGAQAQSDWGEYPGVLIGGEPTWLHSFVMALSWSRRPAIVWSERKDQVSWIACHNGAFRRLGGVAAVNRIDNERTAISHGAGPWGTVNLVYKAYARMMGFHVDACEPRKPWAKGKGEAKVKLGRRAMNPRRRQYDSLEELQVETDERTEIWSKRAISPLTGKTVWETWEMELDFLTPLPEVLPEPFDVVVRRPVHRDCRVHFEGRQYPVPFQYAGLSVEVRGCAGKVQIVHADRIVREYPRHTEERVLVDPSCYEGKSTDRVLAPPPLGRMGRRLQEIYAMPVEQRPVDLYAAVAEVAR